MIEYYQQKVQYHTKVLKQVRKKATFYSLLRAVVFLVLAVLLFQYLSGEHIAYLISTGLALVGFGFLVNRHQSLEQSAAHMEMLITINKEEKDRLNLELSSLDTGSEFEEKHHPYQSDLDIFGKHSIYQLVSRCVLPDARKMLADWLSSHANRQVIVERQEAVKALKNLPDFVQELQSKLRIAMSKKRKEAPAASADDLTLWANNNPGKSARSWVFISLVLILIFLSLLLAVVFFGQPYQILFPSLLLNAVFLVFITKKLHQHSKGIDQAHYMVVSYEQSMALVSEQQFESRLLNNITQTLTSPTSAVGAIRELSSITHRLGARNNMLYAILDLPLLLDAFLLFKIETWKARYAAQISSWTDAIHQMETLASLAAFAHANEEYVFPKVSEKPLLIAKELGHPLIPKSGMITNDYELSELGRVDIITGSNMSGKSTFQRTVGVNLVLLQIGAPVYAQSFTAGAFRIFTSMRTKDDLEEHASSFYAELKRIRDLLRLVEMPEPVFFLLDEILKGTNSQDRHTGAVALIKKLITKNAMGLVSTHDLSLGAVEENEQRIRNFSFNSEINGREIVFDYKLTRGVCKSFNASQLMKNMGILD